MYSPLIGQFAQRDPEDYAAGDENLYRYVGNGPTDFTDASGLAGVQASVRAKDGKPVFENPPNLAGIPVYRATNMNIPAAGVTFLAIRITGEFKHEGSGVKICDLQLEAYFAIMYNPRILALAGGVSPKNTVGHEQRHVMGGLLQLELVKPDIIGLLENQEKLFEHNPFPSEVAARQALRQYRRAKEPYIYELIRPGLLHQMDPTTYKKANLIPYNGSHPVAGGNNEPIGGWDPKEQVKGNIDYHAFITSLAKSHEGKTPTPGYGFPPGLDGKDLAENGNWYFGASAAASDAAMADEAIRFFFNNREVHHRDQAPADALLEKFRKQAQAEPAGGGRE